MPKRRRLDEELVERGFFSSTDEALRSIMAGEVSTTDRRMTSAGERVSPDIELAVRGRATYVSRGGLKLEHGLTYFSVDPTGLACVDVGCSTGGFTDCLLRHGAALVISVDVGYAQFSWSLRQDPRVRLFERTNACDLPSLVGEDVAELAVCDVSFTSVLTVLPAVCRVLKPGGRFLTLVKPQFECSREEVGEGGIVRDEAARKRAVDRVTAGLADAGFAVSGCCESPIRGHKGNVEYLVCGELTG